MYKGGLVFGLICQVLMALGLIIAGIALGLAFDSAPTAARVAADGYRTVAPVDTSGIRSVVGIVLFVLSIIPIVQIIFTSLALSNLAKSERGEKNFSKGLAMTAGLMCLPTNIIAGILILAGMSDAESGSGQRRSYNGGAAQDRRERRDNYNRRDDRGRRN